MTDALIAYGRDALKKNGILTSGDAAKEGIGAMTAARWQAFYDATKSEGLYPPGLDVGQAYTLQFVNKRVGLH